MGGPAAATEIVGVDAGLNSNERSSVSIWLSETGIPMRIEIEVFLDGGVLEINWLITQVNNVTVEPPIDLPPATGITQTQANLTDVLVALLVHYTDTETFDATPEEIMAITPEVPLVDRTELTFGTASMVTDSDGQAVLIISTAFDGSYWCVYRTTDGFTLYGQGASLDDVDSPEDCSAEAWIDQ